MEGIMRTSLTLLVFAIALVAAPTHRFACSDYMQGKVFIVDAEGKVEGSYDAPNSNDLWALPNGNLPFNAGNGVKKVTRDKRRVVFSYESSSEVYACQRRRNRRDLLTRPVTRGK